MKPETRATSISDSVKIAVWQRDGFCCILCGAPGLPEAHIVRRSQGGRGIEQNVVTLCRQCHREFDEGKDRKILTKIVMNYIRDLYPDWTKEKVTYHKGGKND